MSAGKVALTFSRNIYLVGFMGAGKTTVGQLLAKRLGRSFADTDDLIQQTVGQTIAEIFANRGESGFREMESQIIQQVAATHGTVVALGGGAVLSSRNRELIRNSGVTVYLAWDFQALLPRILNDRSRPLVWNGSGAREITEIETLLRKREPLYRQAEIVINCQREMAPGEIVDRIIQALKEREDDQDPGDSRS